MAAKTVDEKVKLAEQALPRLIKEKNARIARAADHKKRLDAALKAMEAQQKAVMAAYAAVKTAFKTFFAEEMKSRSKIMSQEDELIRLLEKLIALRDDPKAFESQSKKVDWNIVKKLNYEWGETYMSDAGGAAVGKAKAVLTKGASSIEKTFANL